MESLKSHFNGYSRREFGRMAMAALPAAVVCGRAATALAQTKPNSMYHGVQIGVLVPFSFREEGPDIEGVLKGMVRVGSNSAEMQNDAPEPFAGAPAAPASGRGGGGGGRGRGTPPSPEQQAAQRAYVESLRKWRETVPMTKFEEIRRMYDAAGVRIDAYRIQATNDSSDGEIDYIFNAARAMGANHVTMQVPMINNSRTEVDLPLTGRIGKFAEKHKMPVGFHAEWQEPDALWDGIMKQSPNLGIQLDLGNYVGAFKEGKSPIAFIEKNHDRIYSLHLKDRRGDMVGTFESFPFGTSETPLREVLQLMKRRKSRFVAFIELGYAIPAGSTRLDETIKCLKFAQDALA
jgi:hypothetical protein